VAKVLKDEARPGDDPTRVSDLRRRLFLQLGAVNGGDGSMAYLMGQLKAPIPTIRHAVFDVLGGAARQRSGWGLRELFGYAGFREFMESRTTETSKEGKEWKFSVMEEVGG
jgi:hypothetical protein